MYYIYLNNGVDDKEFIIKKEKLMDAVNWLRRQIAIDKPQILKKEDFGVTKNAVRLEVWKDDSFFLYKSRIFLKDYEWHYIFPPKD